jgi:hypothetical protein
MYNGRHGDGTPNCGLFVVNSIAMQPFDHLYSRSVLVIPFFNYLIVVLTHAEIAAYL